MSVRLNRANKANHFFQLANKHWTDGELRSAFRLFLSAARAGFVPAFDILAHFYGTGKGTKVDQDASLYWYTQSYRNNGAWHKRTCREGLSVAANNIGCIWRDRGQAARAISWFRRAVELGDGDANLNIAEIYLRNRPDRTKAIHYLQKTMRAAYVTDWSIEEAKRLLSRLRKSERRLASSSKKQNALLARRLVKRATNSRRGT